MSSVVLDASAVLAYLRSEPGGETVGAHLTGSIMSAVNYSEVLKKSVEYGGSADVTAELLDRAQIQLISFDKRQAKLSAELWPLVRTKGLSFADRACLALGMSTGLAVITTDKRMSETAASADVRLVNRSKQREGKK